MKAILLAAGLLVAATTAQAAGPSKPAPRPDAAASRDAAASSRPAAHGFFCNMGAAAPDGNNGEGKGGGDKGEDKDKGGGKKVQSIRDAAATRDALRNQASQQSNATGPQ